ncbi:hypothetical protein D3C86_1575760 [compost metagenome]
MACFLVSDLASYVIGSAINVDGGSLFCEQLVCFRHFVATSLLTTNLCMRAKYPVHPAGIFLHLYECQWTALTGLGTASPHIQRAFTLVARS